MVENGIYFAKSDFYSIIRNVGGQWNDSKERPIVCLLKLDEYDNIYWAIPIGNWNHRNENAKRRINSFLNRDEAIFLLVITISEEQQRKVYFLSAMLYLLPINT